MRVIFPLTSILIIVFFMTCLLYAENTGNFKFTKKPEIQQIKPKKPVKIKLKRTVDGRYTWDLTGDDVAEIVQADKRLRKLLNTE